MRGLKAILVLAAGVSLLSSLAVAQRGQVTIVAPEKDSVVRGSVEIVAEKPNPHEGTYAWKVARVGQEAEAEFQANTLADMPFVWDTRVRDENGDRYYPDGKYSITANAFDGDGNLQGTATTTITIENDIPEADVADGVELKILLKTNDALNFTFDGTEKLAFDVYPQVEGAEYTMDISLYDGAYGLKMLSGAGTGDGGIMRETCTNGVTYIRGMQPEYVKDVGKEFTQQYNGDGSIEPRKEDAPHFPLGECYIKLPARKVTLGARPWKGDMQLLVELYTQRQHLLTAEHRIDGFEWVAGRRCARVKTTFEEKAVQLDINVQGRPAKWTGDLTGTRVTYFAYEAGFPVSMEDSLQGDGELEFKQQMAGMGMGEMGGMAGAMPGTPGMPGMPGMMGEGMMGGGMAMPGMPGMPGMPMGEGMMGMPGMAGPGMPGMPGMMGMGGTATPGMPGMPGMMGMGGTATPGMPGMPGMMGMGGTATPGMPGMMGMGGSAMPGMPGMKGMGGMATPGTPGMPGMPMGEGMGAGIPAGEPGMMGGEAGMGGMPGAVGGQPQKVKTAIDLRLRIGLKP